MIILNKYKLFTILCIFGIFHWIIFSVYGGPVWKSYDWLGTYPWFDITKNSILSLKLPYHATAYDAEVIGSVIAAGTNGSFSVRWFSSGFNIVSPQIILLSILSVAQYISFSLIFYFSLGTYGIFKWIKELNLSLTASTFLFIICLPWFSPHTKICSKFFI